MGREWGGGHSRGAEQHKGEGSNTTLPPTIINNAGPVNSLSTCNIYDSSNLINEYFNIISEDENFTILDKTLYSPYYDIQELINKYGNSCIPLVISVNIQCINSKHSNLTDLVQMLESNNVLIFAIVVQETWNFKYADLIAIPGFQNIQCKLRAFSKGGGVGIFVKNGISFNVVQTQNLYTERIFENITIELTNHNQQCLLSSIYRSPTPIHNLSQREQMNQFLTKLDEFLYNANSYDVPSYVFLDANIDLSTLNTNDQKRYLKK